MSVPSFTLPSASAFTSAVSVPRSSILLCSALSSASGVSVPVPELLASLSISVLLVLGSSAFPALSSISGMSMPVPESLALFFVFVIPVPRPGLFPPPFPTWSFPQTPMPVLER